MEGKSTGTTARKAVKEIETILAAHPESWSNYSDQELATILDAIVAVVSRHTGRPLRIRPTAEERAALQARYSQPSITAEIHSDDHRAEASFLANRWFSEASDDAIRMLASTGWAGDTAADEVALFMESIDFDVEQVLEYTRKAVSIADEAMGFEVSVDSEQAFAWLHVHRPELAQELAPEGHA